MRAKQPYIYDIFKTPWGWFGVLGTEAGIARIQLPDTEKEAVKKKLLKDIEGAERDSTVFSALKTKVLSYYQGHLVNFRDIRVQIDNFTPFQQNVLINLQKIIYGHTVTYSQLAELAGSPRASRAIGSVMAATPLPLIIPCHRVIKSDGTLGNFSGPGGSETKKRMLNLEKSVNNQ